MEERGWIARREFWPLLWLPAGVAVQAAVRFLPATDGPPEPGMWVATALMGGASLVVVAPVRAAAGARLPPPLAAGRDDRGGVGICRAARPRGDRPLCGDIQPSGVGRLVVAGA